jgi:hypothetical protein
MNFKKNSYFCGSFLPSWIRIPDPLTRLNPDLIRIRNPAFYTVLSQVAEDWRLCEESVRKEYEEKAQRYNAEEEKRWRQKLYLHQQQQMHLQASRRGRGVICFNVLTPKSLPDPTRI